jgi:hypothetical protein
MWFDTINDNEQFYNTGIQPIPSGTRLIVDPWLTRAQLIDMSSNNIAIHWRYYRQLESVYTELIYRHQRTTLDAIIMEDLR